MKRTTKQQFKPEYIHLVIQSHPDEGLLLYDVSIHRSTAHELAADMNEKYRGGNYKWTVRRHLLQPLPARGKTNPSKKVARGKKTKKQ